MKSVNRREFLDLSVRGAGAGLVLASGASVMAAPASDRKENPFGYDVGRHSKTDPKWLHYDELRKFAVKAERPRRIVADTRDQLYVATAVGIVKFDTQGNRVKEIRTSQPARSVAIADDGTIYAGMKNVVAVFDAEGQRTGTWEPANAKAWFTGMTAGKNDLFVADAGNRVVLRYDRSGKLVGKIGEKNPDRNVPGLILPSPYLDVKLGSDGVLRINNPGRHRVELYTADGDLELFWGKPGIGVEGFCGCCNPIGIWPLPNGECVTCEKGLPRVKISSSDGTLLSVVAGPEAFPENGRTGSARDPVDGTMGGLDAAATRDGEICILDLVAGEVRVMRKKATHAKPA